MNDKDDRLYIESDTSTHLVKSGLHSEILFTDSLCTGSICTLLFLYTHSDCVCTHVVQVHKWSFYTEGVLHWWSFYTDGLFTRMVFLHWWFLAQVWLLYLGLYCTQVTTSACILQKIIILKIFSSTFTFFRVDSNIDARNATYGVTTGRSGSIKKISLQHNKITFYYKTRVSTFNDSLYTKMQKWQWKRETIVSFVLYVAQENRKDRKVGLQTVFLQQKRSNANRQTDRHCQYTR